MSSLNATQADGYYIPPDYFSSGAYKNKSLNQFQNSKGHNQYLQNNVVRFELPYDGFCTQCEAHVGKGTRFNATKQRVDHYYTTPIYEFHMTCRVCYSATATAKTKTKKQTFVIRTNPSQRCFDYISGIRKQQNEFDTQEAQSLGYIDTDQPTHTLLHHSSNNNNNHDLPNKPNALDGLETKAMGQRKAMTEREVLQTLLRQNQVTKQCDADTNSQLRSLYRTERKAKKRRLQHAASLGFAPHIQLLDHDDTTTAIPASTRDAIRHRAAKQTERQCFSKLNSLFSKHPSKRNKQQSRNTTSYNHTQIPTHNQQKKHKLQLRQSNDQPQPSLMVVRTPINIQVKPSTIHPDQSSPSYKKEPSIPTTLSNLLSNYSSDSE